MIQENLLNVLKQELDREHAVIRLLEQDKLQVHLSDSLEAKSLLWHSLDVLRVTSFSLQERVTELEAETTPCDEWFRPQIDRLIKPFKEEVNHLPGELKQAKLITGLFTLFSLLGAEYTVAHAIAFTQKDGRSARLLLHNLKRITPLIAEIGSFLPKLVSYEMSLIDPGIDLQLGDKAARVSHQAWSNL